MALNRKGGQCHCLTMIVVEDTISHIVLRFDELVQSSEGEICCRAHHANKNVNVAFGDYFHIALRNVNHPADNHEHDADAVANRFNPAWHCFWLVRQSVHHLASEPWVLACFRHVRLEQLGKLYVFVSTFHNSMCKDSSFLFYCQLFLP